MELCTGRRLPLMERESGSTATLITMERPLLSDTLLERTDSGSWKELMFPPELLVRNLLHLLPRLLHLSLLPSRLLLQSRLLPPFAKLLLYLSQLTMTMLMNQLTPTSTHSSTHMTQLTVTSSTTEMEQTLDQTMPTLLSTVFLPVLTVPVSTHSSTHLMPLINLVFSSSELLPLLVQLQSSSQLNLSNRPSPSSPLKLQETSLLVSSSLKDLSLDSTLTSTPSRQLKTRNNSWFLFLLMRLTDLAVRAESQTQHLYLR